MRRKTVLLMLLIASVSSAENLEKTQKKELEAQAKLMMAEAERLEKAGELAEARAKYTESQALLETNEAKDAIKHLDDKIHQRVKDVLNESRKLYEARKFKDAVSALEAAMKLQASQGVLAYDLALCHHELGERDKALESLKQAKVATADPRPRARLSQMLTYFTTDEAGPSFNDSDKQRIAQVNRLSESVGMDVSLEDEEGAEGDDAGADPSPVDGQAARMQLSSGTHSNVSASHGSSLCSSLAELKPLLPKSPAETFNLANCAESNGRTSEAAKLLEHYLELAPAALDASDVRARIADLKALLTLLGPNGVEVRRLYASVYSWLAEHRYDRALADLNQANTLAPDFPQTKWKLALLYEAIGNVERAKENFTKYKEMTAEQSAKDEADLHLTTLEAKRTKYDEEIDEAGDIVADLLNRAMNLTFNEAQNRSALRASRARVKKKSDRAKARFLVGGFAVPFAYAQQQLSLASEHLQVALALFPLGVEANELMGWVFLQANDGPSAIKSFDVVASQGLPVAFYAELRGHKQDQAVKCELTHDRVRLIFLSSYDKKGQAVPPDPAAGEDGLGDLVVEPEAKRQAMFASMDLSLADIKKVETDKGVLKVKLTKQEVMLSPLYLPSYTPIEGPQARRFANNYTRLFVRYPGLEDSKLGAEGMTGGEKFKMGYKIASASADIAMSGFSPMSAISSLQDAISIARTIQAAMASLSVSFAKWEKSVNDEQRLLAGKSFKAIPTGQADLGFVQEMK